jgi:COMPASS component SWD3
VAWSPDGHYLATASDDTTLRVWDTHTGACVRILQAHTHHVVCCAFSAGANMLVSGAPAVFCGLCMVKVLINWWQAPHLVSTLSQAAISCLPHLDVSGADHASHTLPTLPRLLPRPVLLPRLQVSGGFDEVMIVWDVQHGRPIKIIPGHSDPVSGVAFSGDPGHSEVIASCSFDGLA